MYRGKVVHFFGFRGVEYISAVRAYIEYDSVNDIGVFANKETEDRIHSYRREYADMLGVDKTV